MTVASSHGSEKIFPIMIQFFDSVAVKVTGCNYTPNETAGTIPDIIMNILENYALTEKCLSNSG